MRKMKFYGKQVPLAAEQEGCEHQRKDGLQRRLCGETKQWMLQRPAQCPKACPTPAHTAVPAHAAIPAARSAAESTSAYLPESGAEDEPKNDCEHHAPETVTGRQGGCGAHAGARNKGGEQRFQRKRVRGKRVVEAGGIHHGREQAC